MHLVRDAPFDGLEENLGAGEERAIENLDGIDKSIGGFFANSPPDSSAVTEIAEIHRRLAGRADEHTAGDRSNVRMRRIHAAVDYSDANSAASQAFEERHTGSMTLPESRVITWCAISA